MKTITRKPINAKSAPADAVTITIKPYSDAKGPEASVSWVIKSRAELPRPDSLNLQFGTLKALVKCYEESGWRRSQMIDLARVRQSESGFQVEYYPTLADARAAEATRKHCCPFCMKSDMIEEIEWCGERFDGTDFRLPALRCNRCDMLAPKRVWRRMNKDHAETSPRPSKVTRG